MVTRERDSRGGTRAKEAEVQRQRRNCRPCLLEEFQRAVKSLEPNVPEPRAVASVKG